MANKIKIDNALLKRQKRKIAKTQKGKKISCRILIVCEGTKTEPNYFRQFRIGENSHFLSMILNATEEVATPLGW